MTAKENAEIVEKFFKDDDWTFEKTVDDDGDVIFRGGIGGLEGAYNSVRFTVLAEEGDIQNFTTLPASAKGHLAEISEFLHRAGFRLRNGDFRLDFSDGEIQFHITWPDEVLHGPDPVERLRVFMMLPATIMAKYAKGISAILLGLATPEKALELCD